MVIKRMFSSYEEANSFIRDYEVANGLSFVTWKSDAGFSLGKGHMLNLFNKKVRFPTEDFPYVHVLMGKCNRACNRGDKVRKHKMYKKRVRVSKGFGQRDKKDEDDHIPSCKAELVIRNAFVFPQFEFDNAWDKKRKTMVADKIYRTFDQSMYYESLYVVIMDEEHTGHQRKLPGKTDNRVLRFLDATIDLGYHSPFDVNERLKTFLSKLEGDMDISSPRFFPGLERLRKLCFPRVMKYRNLEREKGFSHDLTDGLERMRELESETECKFMLRGNDIPFGEINVYHAYGTNQLKEILTAPENVQRCGLDTFCVPYIILQTKVFECSHGVDYKNKFVHPFTPRQRKHMSKEGMVNCLGRCVFKEIALFPQYRVDDTLLMKNVREKIMHRLHTDLRSKTAEYERGVAYAFPVVEEHSGHSVREANGHLFLDEKLKAQLTELVEEGVKSVAEMRRHLKMYLKHNFDTDTMPGPFCKKFRPSTQTVMNLMYDAGLAPEDIIQDIDDPVPYISKPSLYKDLSTRMEEKRKRKEASATLSILPESESLVETSYDTLIDNLDVFQTIDLTPSKSNPPKLDISPSKIQSSIVASDSQTGEEKSKDNFSEVLFKKQSECQALLEELLQGVYELQDTFRLRDILCHLKKLVDFIKNGRLLCDVIPLKRRKPADTSSSSATGSGQSGEGENTFTATPVDISTGLPSASSSEEPPTKIVIMDQNEEVTEVEIPKGYDSSEIVIYQEPDGQGGEQIYLVDQKSMEENSPEPDTQQIKSFFRFKKCFRDNVEVKKLQETRDEVRKAMIKVKCKQHFTTEQILEKLDVEIDRSVKVGMKTPVLNVQVNSACDLRQQREEAEAFIKQKNYVNMLEANFSKEDMKDVMSIQSEMNYEAIDVLPTKPARHADPAPHADPLTNPESHDFTETTANDVEAEMFEVADEGKQDKRVQDVYEDHQYSGPSRNVKDGQSGVEAGSATKAAAKTSVKAIPGTSKVVKSNDKGPTSSTHKRVAGTPTKTVYPKIRPKVRASALLKDLHVQLDPSLKDKSPIVKETPKKPTAGDTLTITGSPFNPLAGNLSGGLVSINNMLFTSTPYGLVPAVGMPVIFGGQNQPFAIGAPNIANGIQINSNNNGSVNLSSASTPSTSTNKPSVSNQGMALKIKPPVSVPVKSFMAKHADTSSKANQGPSYNDDDDDDDKTGISKDTMDIVTSTVNSIISQSQAAKDEDHEYSKASSEVTNSCNKSDNIELIVLVDENRKVVNCNTTSKIRNGMAVSTKELPASKGKKRVLVKVFSVPKKNITDKGGDSVESQNSTKVQQNTEKEKSNSKATNDDNEKQYDTTTHQVEQNTGSKSSMSEARNDKINETVKVVKQNDRTAPLEISDDSDNETNTIIITQNNESDMEAEETLSESDDYVFIENDWSVAENQVPQQIESESTNSQTPSIDQTNKSNYTIVVKHVQTSEESKTAATHPISKNKTDEAKTNAQGKQHNQGNKTSSETLVQVPKAASGRGVAIRKVKSNSSSPLQVSPISSSGKQVPVVHAKSSSSTPNRIGLKRKATGEVCQKGPAQRDQDSLSGKGDSSAENTPTRRTRGRQMRFSRSGEKLE